MLLVVALYRTSISTHLHSTEFATITEVIECNRHCSPQVVAHPYMLRSMFHIPQHDSHSEALVKELLCLGFSALRFVSGTLHPPEVSNRVLKGKLYTVGNFSRTAQSVFYLRLG